MIPGHIQRIFLVGLMGSGKSTVAKLLAEALDWVFVDLDKEISLEYGLSIHEIFESVGKAEFRDFESRALETCSSAARAVIACGGGAVLAEANRSLLEEQFVIWLDVSPEIAAIRVGGDSGRPLLKEARSPAETLTQLLRERKIYYQNVASLSVSADGDAESVCNHIIKMLLK